MQSMASQSSPYSSVGLFPNTEGIIMKICGQRTRSVFKRYAIVFQTDIADALRSFEIKNSLGEKNRA
jgi:hypothetical protein